MLRFALIALVLTTLGSCGLWAQCQENITQSGEHKYYCLQSAGHGMITDSQKVLDAEGENWDPPLLSFIMWHVNNPATIVKVPAEESENYADWIDNDPVGHSTDPFGRGYDYYEDIWRGSNAWVEMVGTDPCRGVGTCFNEN